MKQSYASAVAGVILVAALLAGPAPAQIRLETGQILRLVADRQMSDASFQFRDARDGRMYRYPERAPLGATLRVASPSNDWRYWNGILNIAMARLGDRLADTGYTAFPGKNIAFAFDNWQYFAERHTSERKWEYPFGQYFMMEELDDCGAMGGATIEVFRTDRQERYRAYIDSAAFHILTKQGRLDDGTLVRSFPRLWTVWADDLYMSVVFLSRMGELTGARKYFDDAAMQVVNFQRHLFDEAKGLMHHCWYSDVQRSGVAFWGRANGWALLAQVDLLDRIAENHPMRDSLLSLLLRHIRGVVRYQSSQGLWHQLLDREDSYLETSCSAMFTYAIARAVNRRYIGAEYAGYARRGWEGVRSRIRADGQIEGICAGTGVAEDLAHYYARPTPLNDPHGIGAVILAGAEMLSMTR
jgi:rhamnogalacturonyl hydrolase YesR